MLLNKNWFFSVTKTPVFPLRIFLLLDLYFIFVTYHCQNYPIYIFYKNKNCMICQKIEKNGIFQNYNLLPHSFFPFPTFISFFPAKTPGTEERSSVPGASLQSLFISSDSGRAPPAAYTAGLLWLPGDWSGWKSAHCSGGSQSGTSAGSGLPPFPRFHM